MHDKDLRGVIAASLTPVTDGLDIDVPRLSAHVGGLLADGCDYVSTFGTTGEGASFSTRQKVMALEGLAASGGDMARQVPGVMTPTVDDAVDMVRAIARLGCRAALVLPPFYYPATGEGVADFYGAVLEATAGAKVDIVLYNIPQMSRFAFTPAVIRSLIDRHGRRIAGLKDSTGDRDNGVMLARSFPELSIFTGDDRVLPDLLDAGGAGIIGGMPNLFAAETAAFCRAPKGEGAAGQISRARARIEAVEANGSLLALKGVLARTKADAGWQRTMPPLQPLPAAQVAEVERVFAATGFAAGAAAA